MELKIIGKGKNTLRIEIEDEDESFANLLAKTLLEEKETDSASFQKDHPQMGNPVLLLVSEKADPTKLLKRAARKIREQSKELNKEVEKVL